MKSYRIITGDTVGSIEEQVNTAMSEGWVPIGGLSSSAQAGHQAMVYSEPRICSEDGCPRMKRAMSELTVSGQGEVVKL